MVFQSWRPDVRVPMGGGLPSTKAGGRLRCLLCQGRRPAECAFLPVPGPAPPSEARGSVLCVSAEPPAWVPKVHFS